MTSVTTTPSWTDDVVVNAVWVATRESAEWVASQVDGLLGALAQVFEIPSWVTSTAARWEGTAEQKAGIIRGAGLRDAFGEVEPGDGFGLTFSGAGPRVGMHVRVSAGADTVGVRLPLHRLNITLRNMAIGGVDAAVGDAVVVAVAQHWRPAAVSVADVDFFAAAARGGWKVPYGYRVWMSSDVGVVEGHAVGLIVTPVAGGSLLAAPDSWSAAEVIAALDATFTQCGLDEIAH